MSLALLEVKGAARSMRIALAINFSLCLIILLAVGVKILPPVAMIGLIPGATLMALLVQQRREIARWVIRRRAPYARSGDARRIARKTWEDVRLRLHAEGLPEDSDAALRLRMGLPRTTFRTNIRIEGSLSGTDRNLIAHEIHQALSAKMSRLEIARVALDLGLGAIDLPAPPLSAHQRLEIAARRAGERETG